MNRRLRYLVRISGDRDRQLMISGLILAVICLALCVNLTIMLSKCCSANPIQQQIKNETNETANYVSDMTSTNLLYTVTSKEPITVSEESILPTMNVNQIEIYTNHSLSMPVQYETFGRSLGSSLYYDLQQLCRVTGYISSVSLRLFSEWTGDTVLYLFIISSDIIIYEISYRYSINPQRNTTEWQTINIPLYVLPINIGNLLAIGMQENSGTNQIYAIKTAFGMSGININKNTTTLTTKSDYNNGVAFSYITVHND